MARSRQRQALLAYKKEIEEWVQNERSDEWIAAALGTSASSIQSFRSRRGIYRHVSKGRPASVSKVLARLGKPASFVGEGVLEHGREEETGVGVWLDPSVAADPAWQAKWERHSAVKVIVTPERLIIMRDEEGDTDDKRHRGSFDDASL